MMALALHGRRRWLPALEAETGPCSEFAVLARFKPRPPAFACAPWTRWRQVWLALSLAAWRIAVRRAPCTLARLLLTRRMMPETAALLDCDLERNSLCALMWSSIVGLRSTISENPFGHATEASTVANVVSETDGRAAAAAVFERSRLLTRVERVAGADTGRESGAPVRGTPVAARRREPPALRGRGACPGSTISVGIPPLARRCATAGPAGL